MDNRKNQDIDDLIDNWASSFDDIPQITNQEFQNLIDKDKKHKRLTKVFNPMQFIIIAIMCVLSTAFAPNTLGVILLLMMLLPTIYFMLRDIRFRQSLERQDHAVSVVNFVERRKLKLTEYISYLRVGTYMIYPILVAMSTNNIIHYLKDDSPIILKILLIAINVVVGIKIVFYLEGSIKEFKVKLQALK